MQPLTAAGLSASISAVIEENMTAFASPIGVLLFVYSLLLTRGLESIHEDMDDETVNLTGQFGHCSQELLNLLLTGHATSNVIDGVVPMGDTGLMIKGVLCTDTSACHRFPCVLAHLLDCVALMCDGMFARVPPCLQRGRRSGT